jgi:subtilisin family serine protease
LRKSWARTSVGAHEENLVPRNVDPRLRRDAAGRRAARRARTLEPVFIEVAHPQAAKWVARQPWVTRLVHLVEGYYTARVPTSRVDDLAARDGVVEIEAVKRFQPRLVSSVRRIHGKRRAPQGGAAPDGKGVVVGIVDYGLDFSLTDFRKRGGTRVAYLWDQKLTRRKGEHSPRKYRYGVEYTRRDIERALRRGKGNTLRHDPLGAPDVAGHGTHVAGIAAGNGRTGDSEFPRDKYVGVAPAATLVFVNLDRKDIVDDVGTVKGTLANSVSIAHGVAYCFEQAEQLKMPCVVNLSLGCNGGGHDGNMVLEWVIDALVEKSGRAVVIAAGNDDGSKTHAAGAIAKGKRARIGWMVGRKQKLDPNPNEMEIWYPSNSTLKVRLVAPDGRSSGAAIGPDRNATRVLSGGEKVTIHSDAHTPWNGAARIYIRVEGTRDRDIRFGRWIVELQATRVGRGERGGRVRYDAWIERTLPADGPAEGRSRFARPARETTLATPCTGRNAIVVASFKNTRAERISAFSGRGPTRDGRPKPDLAAPGEWVFSTQAGAGRRDDQGDVRTARVDMRGTSQAAPHVTGIVARMLGLNSFLEAEEIRELLVESATPRKGLARGKWHPKWGYGKVNAARAIELLKERLLRSRR